MQEKIAGKFELVFLNANDVNKKNISDAEIIFGNIKTEFLPEAKSLRFLQLQSAGADVYVSACEFFSTCVLANATGAYGQSVAEHALALWFSLMKNLHLYRDNEQKKFWHDEGVSQTPLGKTALIVGAGDIGLYFAKLCKALGFHTIGIKRRAVKSLANFDEVYTGEKNFEKISESDLVLSILPETNETKNFWDAEKFSKMNAQSFFINVGRGATVNENDLIDALQKNKIQGAALDVFASEPLSANSKLWNLRNCIITPHVAGTDHLRETFERIFDIAMKNLDCYLNGSRLFTEVDLETGYTSNV